MGQEWIKGNSRSQELRELFDSGLLEDKEVEIQLRLMNDPENLAVLEKLGEIRFLAWIVATIFRSSTKRSSGRHLAKCNEQMSLCTLRSFSKLGEHVLPPSNLG